MASAVLPINFSVVVPIAAVLLAAVAAYWNNAHLEKRKARLAFVNEQLRLLYGPLYALSHASQAAWLFFFNVHAKTQQYFFLPGEVPTHEQLSEWMLWMKTVFMPINKRMVESIVSNAHLVEQDDMPLSFLELIAHVESYRVVMAKWEEGDYSVYTALLNFPETLAGDVRDSYLMLKRRQEQLMSKATRREPVLANAGQPAPGQLQTAVSHRRSAD